MFLFALSQWLEAPHPAACPPGHSRAAGSGAARGAGPPRRPRRARAGGDDGRRRDRARASGRHACRSTASSSAGRARSTRSSLTGESLPVDKATGAEVFAGTVNGHGSLDVRGHARRARHPHGPHHPPGGGGAVAPRAAAGVRRSIRPVVHAARVALAALVVAVVPPLAGGDPSVWIYRGLVLLVIACPCALVDLDAGVDRGGALGRGAARRAGQGRHGAGAAGRGGRRGVRQDRDADAGAA